MRNVPYFWLCLAFLCLCDCTYSKVDQDKAIKVFAIFVTGICTVGAAGYGIYKFKENNSNTLEEEQGKDDDFYGEENMFDQSGFLNINPEYVEKIDKIEGEFIESRGKLESLKSENNKLSRLVKNLSHSIYYEGNSDNRKIIDKLVREVTTIDNNLKDISDKVIELNKDSGGAIEREEMISKINAIERNVEIGLENISEDLNKVKTDSERNNSLMTTQQVESLNKVNRKIEVLQNSIDEAKLPEQVHLLRQRKSNIDELTRRVIEIEKITDKINTIGEECKVRYQDTEIRINECTTERKRNESSMSTQQKQMSDRMTEVNRQIEELKTGSNRNQVDGIKDKNRQELLDRVKSPNEVIIGENLTASQQKILGDGCQSDYETGKSGKRDKTPFPSVSSKSVSRKKKECDPSIESSQLLERSSQVCHAPQTGNNRISSIQLDLKTKDKVSTTPSGAAQYADVVKRGSKDNDDIIESPIEKKQVNVLGTVKQSIPKIILTDTDKVNEDGGPVSISLFKVKKQSA